MSTIERRESGPSDLELIERVSVGITCPQCGLTLAPVLPGNPLSFGCERGHVHQLDELLRTPAADKSALERAAKTWERKLMILREMAGSAMRRGEAVQALDIYREVSTLEVRIHVIRRALQDAPNAK